MLFPLPHRNAAAAWSGRRVGLFGGSFNPPHAGHRLVALRALQGLRLDCIWWLVSPHNPLKDASTLLPLQERLALCQEIVGHHPAMLVSDIEDRESLFTTYDSLCFLRRIFPLTSFVFITGLDNALSFHLWHRWRDIPGLAATAHVIRPPVEGLVRNCPLRMLGGQYHVAIRGAQRVHLAPGFSYWIREGPARDERSSNIRNSNNNNYL